LFEISFLRMRYRYQDLILVLWGRPPKTVENLNFARKTFGQVYKATQHNDKLSNRNYLSLIEGTVWRDWLGPFWPGCLESGPCKARGCFFYFFKNFPWFNVKI
jgi:hypothetical protein